MLELRNHGGQIRSGDGGATGGGGNSGNGAFGSNTRLTRIDVAFFAKKFTTASSKPFSLARNSRSPGSMNIVNAVTPSSCFTVPSSEIFACASDTSTVTRQTCDFAMSYAFKNSIRS